MIRLLYDSGNFFSRARPVLSYFVKAVPDIEESCTNMHALFPKQKSILYLVHLEGKWFIKKIHFRLLRSRVFWFIKSTFLKIHRNIIKLNVEKFADNLTGPYTSLWFVHYCCILNYLLPPAETTHFWFK